MRIDPPRPARPCGCAGALWPSQREFGLEGVVFEGLSDPVLHPAQVLGVVDIVQLVGVDREDMPRPGFPGVVLLVCRRYTTRSGWGIFSARAS